VPAASVGHVSDDTDRQLKLDAIEASGIASQLSDDRARLILGVEPPRADEHCLATGQVLTLLGLGSDGPSDHRRLMPDAED
jgi:hypothetical protein